jgi:hypothetical protein
MAHGPPDCREPRSGGESRKVPVRVFRLRRTSSARSRFLPLSRKDLREPVGAGPPPRACGPEGGSGATLTITGCRGKQY